MSAPPFKVKAIHDYTSPHEGDLNFPSGQLITVTAEEDTEWYIGEYTETSGEKKQGLFPKNFVERYEPKTPPRPVRVVRPREEHEVPPPPPEATEREIPARPSEEIEDPMETGASATMSAPAPVPQQTPKPAAPIASTETPAPLPQLPPAPKPAPVLPAAPPISQSKPTPPAVADKPSSFKDRIAAFNKAAAPPVAPFKPPGAPASGFIKKPFVAPPPARNAYVPPPIHEVPLQKVYRREEDPEIVEREAEDHASAERAGLVGGDEPQGEDSAKPTSLKERIALLQKQQLEQAQRRAETTQKEKPKRPPKKHSETRETGEAEGHVTIAGLEEADVASRVDQSIDIERESREPIAPTPLKQRTSLPPGSSDIGPRSDAFSDGNDADQSAAGETAEEMAGMSSDPEDAERKQRSDGPAVLARAPGAPTTEPDVGDQEDTTEDDVEEEEEMDAETRRRMELRERMAKMSGGMGMAGMFGPPAAMPMPGAAPLRKKKPTGDNERTAVTDRDEASMASPPSQRVPMIPIPGMQRLANTQPEQPTPVVEKEEEPSLPITTQREPDEVPDVEEIQPEPDSRVQHAKRTVPPPLPQERPVPAPPIPVERGLPPPVPGSRPGPPPAESRAVPPHSSNIIQSASSGSESDDEMSSHTKYSSDQPRAINTQLPTRGPPPPVPNAAPGGAPPPPRPQGPRSPQSPSSKRASYFTEFAQPAASTSPIEKRSSRVPTLPSVSIGSPIMSSPSSPRPPPPLPPNLAPPSRASTINEKPRQADDEGETEYEGDYDTDIASGAGHREALRSYGRESSYDDSTTADEGSAQSPEIPAAPPPIPVTEAPRSVAPPPPPPHSAPRDKRQSMEPRAPPPPVPVRGAIPSQDDADHDPYRYYEVSTSNPTSPPMPPARPPEQPMERHAYPLPPMRQSTEASHSMQSQTAQQHDRAPPLPPIQGQPSISSPAHPRTSSQVPRQSLDVHRSSTSASRRSMDQPRGEHGFIAVDIDIGESSLWWSVPNTPPPAIQSRRGKDVLYEIEESSTSKRGGKTMISKDVYVLYMDYSQSTITALFDAQNPTDVIFEQRHKGPPARLRQDQLEESYRRFGTRIVDAALKAKETTIGDGSAQCYVLELLRGLPDALQPVGTRAYGALVYANLANASVQQLDEIRPGDIMTLRNAKLQGKHGSMHKNYSMDVGTGGKDHVGIVLEWDGTKKKARLLEQGRDAKDGKKGKVQIESYKLGDLKSGEVKVWRVMDRGWVGWEGSN